MRNIERRTSTGQLVVEPQWSTNGNGIVPILTSKKSAQCAKREGNVWYSLHGPVPIADPSPYGLGFWIMAYVAFNAALGALMAYPGIWAAIYGWLVHALSDG